MPKNLGVVTMTLLMVTGCADSRDDRLVEMAQQSLRQQARQNERLAGQSKLIAEAARRLVIGDAEARKDLLAAQRQLTSDLHAERANLDRQREEMEQERRTIAAQRHRDPIIAQAINAFGLLLACLAPLALAAHTIHAVSHDDDDNAALSELLLTEMVTEKPMLLPIGHPRLPAIGHSRAIDEDANSEESDAGE